MKNLLLISFLFCVNFCFVQESDAQLAQFYYGKGEYEKAAPYLEKVYKNDPNKFNFKNYFTCLLKLEDKKEAEKLIKRQINLFDNEFDYQFIYADFFENEGKTKEANKIYQNLTQNNVNSAAEIEELAFLFRNANKPQFALNVLEKGRKTYKDRYDFNLAFAETYIQLNQKNKALEEYVLLIDKDYAKVDVVKSNILKYFDIYSDDKDADLVKTIILDLVQKNPSNEKYNELLIWFFIQKKQFSVALSQTKAFNKRTRGDGRLIYELAMMCVENKKYDIAKEAFQYLYDNAETPQYKNDAQFWLVYVSYLNITQNKILDKVLVNEAIEEHQKVLSLNRKNAGYINTVLQLSTLKAYYANRANEAIQDLEKILQDPIFNNQAKAQVKIALADIHVLTGDIWEASLLYMQVDTDFKFEPIGHEAKFKNARIFYYDGDFDFAQSQLDILKQSTSKLIANDAMQLSITITDNYGLDSNYTAMSSFAKADLLLMQHRYDEAFVIFDSIIKQFPFHALVDEITFRKAQAMEEQGKWNEAIAFYEELLKYHSEDILADDALYAMANIYEDHLDNSEKAYELYKKILFDYKDSFFTEEARKKVRIFRGEKVDDI